MGYFNQKGAINKIIVLIIAVCLLFVIIGFFVLKNSLPKKSDGQVKGESIYRRNSAVQKQIINIEKEFMR